MFFPSKDSSNQAQKETPSSEVHSVPGLKYFTDLFSYLPTEERDLIILEIRNYLMKSFTGPKRTNLTFIQVERGGLFQEILAEQGCSVNFPGLYIVTPVSIVFHPDPRKKEAETIWAASENEFKPLKEKWISPWMKSIEQGNDSFLTPDRLRRVVSRSATIEDESHNRFDSTFTISMTMRFPSKYQWSRYSLLPSENQWHEIKGVISVVKFEINQKDGRTRIRLSLNPNDRTWKGLKMWQMSMKEMIDELKDEWNRLILAYPC